MTPRAVRSTVALFVVLALVALAYPGGSAVSAQSSGPTLATLEAAALTVSEVGAGWAVQNQGPAADNLAYVVTYQQGLPDPGAIGITLRLDPSSSTATVAQATVAGIQHIGAVDDFQSATATPPTLGPNAMNEVYTTVSGSVNGAPFSGGVVVWQQGPVLVLVFAAGVELDVNVVSLAQQQYEKLAAGLT